MGLGWGYYLPRNLPQLVDGCVCEEEGGRRGEGKLGGRLKVVLPQLDNGWSWGGVTTYPETCHSWSMGVCVRRRGGGGEKGSWGGG